MITETVQINFHRRGGLITSELSQHLKYLRSRSCRKQNKKIKKSQEISILKGFGCIIHSQMSISMRWIVSPQYLCLKTDNNRTGEQLALMWKAKLLLMQLNRHTPIAAWRHCFHCGKQIAGRIRVVFWYASGLRSKSAPMECSAVLRFSRLNRAGQASGNGPTAMDNPAGQPFFYVHLAAWLNLFVLHSRNWRSRRRMWPNGRSPTHCTKVQNNNNETEQKDCCLVVEILWTQSSLPHHRCTSIESHPHDPRPPPLILDMAAASNTFSNVGSDPTLQSQRSYFIDLIQTLWTPPSSRQDFATPTARKKPIKLHKLLQVLHQSETSHLSISTQFDVVLSEVFAVKIMSMECHLHTSQYKQ